MLTYKAILLTIRGISPFICVTCVVLCLYYFKRTRSQLIMHLTAVKNAKANVQSHSRRGSSGTEKPTIDHSKADH